MSSKYDRIKVLGRIRPLNSKEAANQDEIAVHVNSGKTIEVLNTTASSASSRCFELDAVLDAQTSQAEVTHCSPPFYIGYFPLLAILGSFSFCSSRTVYI